MFENLISGGLKLLGGHLDNQAAEERNRQILADKEQDRALQREFAQSGIQWRAADAAKAGINPHFAIGGGGATYTPSAISLGSGASMSETLGSMGQDVSRAINATRTQNDRENAFKTSMEALTLEKAGLENDVLRAQLASSVQRLKQAGNPPMPSGSGKSELGEHERVPLKMGKQEDRKPLMLGGNRWTTSEGNSNAQDFEDRYGEITDYTFGPAILWNDFMGQTEPFMGEAEGRRFRQGLSKWLPKWLRPR